MRPTHETSNSAFLFLALPVWKIGEKPNKVTDKLTVTVE